MTGSCGERSLPERGLPFDQIDEDPARAELDHRLLVDVLGLPETLCEPDCDRRQLLLPVCVYYFCRLTSC